MYCEPAVSGRRCPGSMEAAVQYTEGFRNGWKLVSLKKSGARTKVEGIGWEWQSLDGCMVKAPLVLESVGKNPTDRGKNGDKTQCSDG